MQPSNDGLEMAPVATAVSISTPNTKDDKGTREEESTYRKRWEDTSKVLLILTYVALFAVVGVGIWQLLDYKDTKYVVAWSVAAFFAAFSIPLTLHAIHLHIIHYRSKLQRHYIRVLWMVPVYSIQSWCALRFNDQKIYLESFREVYEAYAIYNFYSLLRDFLGKDDDERTLKLIADREGPVHHLKMFWLCFTPLLPKWERGNQFLRNTLFGVLQCVLPSPHRACPWRSGCDTARGAPGTSSCAWPSPS